MAVDKAEYADHPWYEGKWMVQGGDVGNTMVGGTVVGVVPV